MVEARGGRGYVELGGSMSRGQGDGAPLQLCGILRCAMLCELCCGVAALYSADPGSSRTTTTSGQGEDAARNPEVRNEGGEGGGM